MCCKYLASAAFISRTSKPSNSVSLSLLLNIREKDRQLSTNHHTENYRLSHKNTSKKTGDASEGHAVPAPLLALVATIGLLLSKIWWLVMNEERNLSEFLIN